MRPVKSTGICCRVSRRNSRKAPFINFLNQTNMFYCSFAGRSPTLSRTKSTAESQRPVN